MYVSGRVQDSLRELESLSQKADINLCSLLALIHGHRLARSVGVSFFNKLPKLLYKTKWHRGRWM